MSLFISAEEDDISVFYSQSKMFLREFFWLVALKHNNILLICELPAIRCCNCIK